MVMMRRLCSFILLSLCLFSFDSGVQGVGVNYGLVADNLPPQEQVVPLLKSRNITKIRIFNPNAQVLTALHESGIQVTIGVPSEDLQQLAADLSSARDWISKHIIPHLPLVHVTSIVVGNEVIPGVFATYVIGAMQNLEYALKDIDLQIPVTTAISLEPMGTLYPPSAGALSEASAPIMGPISSFLATRGYPLLVNAYPFFAYTGDRAQIPLDYALFKDSAAPVPDGQLLYHNLFDAMVDGVYTALEKVGASTVEVVVSETGWPTAGDVDATTANAQAYVNNLIAHQLSGAGTPKRPGRPVETYVFALFSEDLKPAGVEQNWGLYYPNMTEVYHVNF